MAIDYTRTAQLFGEDFVKLRNAKVLLLGVGGVGSFALDCLYKSGVNDITVVDFDRYDTTNTNRQLHSEAHIGEVKVAALQKYYPLVTPIEAKVDGEWIARFDFTPYDVILDAIDDIGAKLALAQKEHKKLISAMGAAKRIDPTRIRVDSIWNTQGDAFAAKIRYELKKRGFKKKYRAVFSDEQPRIKEKGSYMGVTAAFGLVLASEAIKKIMLK